jgi:hypothetical protein
VRVAVVAAMLLCLFVTGRNGMWDLLPAACWVQSCCVLNLIALLLCARRQSVHMRFLTGRPYNNPSPCLQHTQEGTPL